MASIMEALKIKPFVEVSVGQLLWGYEDPLLQLAKDVVSKDTKLPYDAFGLMYNVRHIKKKSYKKIQKIFDCRKMVHPKMYGPFSRELQILQNSD